MPKKVKYDFRNRHLPQEDERAKPLMEESGWGQRPPSEGAFHKSVFEPLQKKTIYSFSHNMKSYFHFVRMLLEDFLSPLLVTPLV